MAANCCDMPSPPVPAFSSATLALQRISAALTDDSEEEADEAVKKIGRPTLTWSIRTQLAFILLWLLLGIPIEHISSVMAVPGGKSASKSKFHELKEHIFDQEEAKLEYFEQLDSKNVKPNFEELRLKGNKRKRKEKKRSFNGVQLKDEKKTRNFDKLKLKDENQKRNLRVEFNRLFEIYKSFSLGITGGDQRAMLSDCKARDDIVAPLGNGMTGTKPVEGSDAIFETGDFDENPSGHDENMSQSLPDSFDLPRKEVLSELPTKPPGKRKRGKPGPESPPVAKRKRAPLPIEVLEPSLEYAPVFIEHVKNDWAKLAEIIVHEAPMVVEKLHEGFHDHTLENIFRECITLVNPNSNIESGDVKGRLRGLVYKLLSSVQPKCSGVWQSNIDELDSDHTLLMFWIAYRDDRIVNSEKHPKMNEGFFLDLIFQLGADINRRNSKGETARDIAFQHGNQDAVAYFKSSDNIESRVCSNNTRIFEWVMRQYQPHTAETTMADLRNAETALADLIKAGCQLDYANSKGERPLNIAMKIGSTVAFRLLLHHGATVDVTTESGLGLFKYAIACSMQTLHAQKSFACINTIACSEKTLHAVKLFACIILCGIIAIKNNADVKKSRNSELLESTELQNPAGSTNTVHKAKDSSEAMALIVEESMQLIVDPDGLYEFGNYPAYLATEDVTFAGDNCNSIVADGSESPFDTYLAPTSDMRCGGSFEAQPKNSTGLLQEAQYYRTRCETDTVTSYFGTATGTSHIETVGQTTPLGTDNGATAYFEKFEINSVSDIPRQRQSTTPEENFIEYEMASLVRVPLDTPNYATYGVNHECWRN